MTDAHAAPKYRWVGRRSNDMNDVAPRNADQVFGEIDIIADERGSNGSRTVCVVGLRRGVVDDRSRSSPYHTTLGWPICARDTRPPIQSAKESAGLTDGGFLIESHRSLSLYRGDLRTAAARPA
jgi:hypothetical protein